MKDKNKSDLKLSGNPLIDTFWGGFLKGGLFILSGPPESGKTILALQFTLNSLFESDRSLILTTKGLADLTINSSIINIDIHDFIDKGLATVVKISESKEALETTKKIFDIKKFYEDVAELIKEYKPSKIILDEITPFFTAGNIESFPKVFIKLKKLFQQEDITALFVLNENVTKLLKEFTRNIFSLSSANIFLYKNEKQISRTNPGVMTAIPNHNYPQRQLTAEYYITINKGIEINFGLQNKSGSISSDN